jgi:hypothetical protein
MKAFIILGAALGLTLFLILPSVADPGQIYGKVYTSDHEVLEGAIRWDKNEASWEDILDGYKDLDRRRPKKYRDEDRRSRRVTIFGLTVYSEGSDRSMFRGSDWANSAQSGIRIGHIKTLIPDGKDEVELILKSGEKARLSNGSTDIGSGIREILIEDKSEGTLELYWDDIDRIEFEATPNVESKFGKRLYGTVATRGGDKYTGFIGWDVDEAYDTDILDGRDNHHSRKIEFSRIKSIERTSSQSSRVILKDGKELELEDSNDIDSGNRGIAISDPGLGRITVNWDEFDIIEFKDPPPGTAYSSFDGGRKLRGTVFTEDGDKFTGDIKWDDDEEYTWELLDGSSSDIDFDIEFGFIKSIEKISSRSSRVTLKDGRVFKLKDSNDVDGDNKGIIIRTGNDEVDVDWEEFGKVEFSD